jgi:hypothetical protein
MPLEDHTLIDTWSEEDLHQLPQNETDDFEYKSSLIRYNPHYRTELQSKITKAASAFWNTGGGILVIGVDDAGKINGGIPQRMGKQRLRDWVDMVLRTVIPLGPYTVRLIRRERPDSLIEDGSVVMLIAFGESADLPHMAPDNRYYVRTGAHSNPANHYLVEAIRARRGLRRPMLRALLRENPQKPGIVELAILAINDLPALNVLINFDPIPLHLVENFAGRLPLIVPVIDRTNPFRMDIATIRRLAYWLGDQPFRIHLQFEGARGAMFEENQIIDHHRSLNPVEIVLSNGQSSAKMLKRIHKQLSRLNSTIEEIVHYTQEDQTPTDEA